MVVEFLDQGIPTVNGFHVGGWQLQIILSYILMRLAYENHVDTILPFLTFVLSWLMESRFYGSGSAPFLDRCRSCVWRVVPMIYDLLAVCIQGL